MSPFVCYSSRRATMSASGHQGAEDKLRLLHGNTKLPSCQESGTQPPHGCVSTCIYPGRHNNFLMTGKAAAGVGVRGYGGQRKCVGLRGQRLHILPTDKTSRMTSVILIITSKAADVSVAGWFLSWELAHLAPFLLLLKMETFLEMLEEAESTSVNRRFWKDLGSGHDWCSDSSFQDGSNLYS